jgi:hypothetical protein
MIQQSAPYLENWINRHEKHIYQSVKQGSSRIELHNTAITNFFTKLKHQTNQNFKNTTSTRRTHRKLKQLYISDISQ